MKKHIMDPQTVLNEIIRLSTELNNVHDEDLLLEKILFEARKITHADAGSIFVRNGDNLVFSQVQNDTLQQKLPAGRKLPYKVFSVPITKKSISGYVAFTGDYVSIPNVYEIPETSPFTFDSFYDKVSEYKTKSMLTLPLKNRMNESIGVLQLINAQTEFCEIVPFEEQHIPLILHFAGIASMVLERAGMTRAMILRMIRMAELRDPKETGAHVNRVASYAVELFEHWAKRRSMSDNEIERKKDVLRMAAMLHDVGKVAISDLILKKPQKFSEDEYAVMKAHTWLGAKLFDPSSSDLDIICKEVALTHHENWDGTGYPGKIDINSDNCFDCETTIRGEDIPIWGRIVAVADVYDALSSHRVYKTAWAEEDVLAEMKKLSGTKFDPEIIEIFIESFENIRAIRQKYPDTSE